MPAAPARDISRSVRAGLPQPASASTSSGSEVALVILPTSISTYPREARPMSGMPQEALATPAPERYKALNPARSARIVAKALITPTICNGDSALRAARNRELAVACLLTLRLGLANTHLKSKE